MGLNYYYALPNKLFDYIRAEVPVLASRLPEIEKIVDSYGIGCFIDSHDPVHIAERIHYMLSDEERRHAWKSGLRRASEALNWEQEEKVLIALFEKIVSS
jgi:glycosyltransferase involved in cell wall biosynthesis